MDYETSLANKIDVMQAAMRGEAIELYDKINLRWVDCDPDWNWHNCHYRVKPQPKSAWVVFNGFVPVQVFGVKDSAEQWIKDHAFDELSVVQVKEVCDE